MDNNEIKQANRKAMPKFLLILVASAVVGGVVGYFAAMYGLDEMTVNLEAAGLFFGMHIAPWLLVAMAVVLPIVCAALYRGAVKGIGAWDGEDEAVYGAIDKKLSLVLWLTSAGSILSFFLITAAYSGGFRTFDSEDSVRLFFLSVAAFLVLMVETIVFQQKSVDAAKKMNPEKKGSVFDAKFQKKWMDSCDEAEKIMIGQCAYKAFAATNTVCVILAIVLAVCALIFDIGFLPSLAVCLIWLVNQSVYFRSAAQHCVRGQDFLNRSPPPPFTQKNTGKPCASRYFFNFQQPLMQRSTAMRME